MLFALVARSLLKRARVPLLRSRCVSSEQAPPLLHCGGNIDPNVLSRVIERGLVADGRLGRFTAVISDRPGGLADLTAHIASTGASIKQVVHDRAFAGSDVSAVHVLCTVEARNHEHLAELRTRLKEHGVTTFDSLEAHQ